MIEPIFVRMLLREHLRKPITGKVLTLGRQAVSLTLGEAVDLFEQYGCRPAEDVIDSISGTSDVRTRIGKRKQHFINDEALFRLLGVDQLHSMDMSDYEQAEIVHDLNDPVSESLYGQYDFIVDGGTFDHVFNVRTAFENVAKMLKRGGRVLHWNAASNYIGAAYICFGPDMFYDYYVLNKFSNVEVLVADLDDFRDDQFWKWHFYRLNHQKPRILRSSRQMLTIVFAEKGPDSSSDRMPVQGKWDKSLEDVARPEEMGAGSNMILLEPKISGTPVVWMPSPTMRVRTKVSRRFFVKRFPFYWMLLRAKLVNYFEPKQKKVLGFDFLGTYENK